MMEMAKKMNAAGGEAGKEPMGMTCTCPECGYQGQEEEFEGDKSMTESESSGMKGMNPKNKIREAIGKAMAGSEENQEE